MPTIRVDLLEGRTVEQKRAFAEAVTEVVVKTLGGSADTVDVIFTDIAKHDWATVKDFSRDVVQHVARVIPDRFVAKSGPKNRVGKIFIDYLRNSRGATTSTTATE